MLGEFLTLSQAALELGCSRRTVLTLIDRGLLTEFTNQLDRRQRLLRRVDVEALRQSAITQKPEQHQAALAA
jgi:excisionase family DNA binding protein